MNPRITAGEAAPIITIQEIDNRQDDRQDKAGHVRFLPFAVGCCRRSVEATHYIAPIR